MKEVIKKHLRHFRAEKIAEIALLRCGLLDIQKVEKGDFDFIASDKEKSEKIIGVEVKETEVTKSAIQKLIPSLSKKFKDSEIPVLVFFIDADSEKGVFAFLNQPKLDVIGIRADLIKKKIKDVLKKHLPMEYPPYKFFQRSDDSKYENGNIYVDEKFNFLRLRNVTLTPIEAKNSLALEISIVGGTQTQPYHVELTSLTQTKLPNFLFFIKGNIQHVDVSLPQGRKILNIRVIPTPDIEEFEMSLACMYV